MGCGSAASFSKFASLPSGFFRLLLVFESGDVKMVQRTTSSNKQLARQERDEALMEIANGSFIPFSYTVKEFYDFWFTIICSVKKGSLIIPTTLTGIS